MIASSSQFEPEPSEESHREFSVMELAPMQVGIVTDLFAPDDIAGRLKSLGLCSGRRVQLVKAGDPIIVRVLGSRLGISARLARSIQVRPDTCVEEGVART
ncbi:MAG: FeoA family protein [Verrucomicrobiota bacterium]|nr:FeoA family protein [Verrucomicrobiota bacterium]